LMLQSRRPHRGLCRATVIGRDQLPARAHLHLPGGFHISPRVAFAVSTPAPAGRLGAPHRTPRSNRAAILIRARRRAGDLGRSSCSARDHYVRVDSNDYSVHPGSSGTHRGSADLPPVRIFTAGRIGGEHERAWASTQHHRPGPPAAARLAPRAGHVVPPGPDPRWRPSLATTDRALALTPPWTRPGRVA